MLFPKISLFVQINAQVFEYDYETSTTTTTATSTTTTEGSPWNFLFARAKEDGTKRNKNRPEGGTRNRKRDKEGWGDEEGAEGEGKRNRRKKNQNLTETEYENDEYTANSDIYQADYSLGDLSEYVGTVEYVTAVPNEDFPEYSDPIPAPSDLVTTTLEVVTPANIVTSRATSTTTGMPLSFENITTLGENSVTSPPADFKIATVQFTAPAPVESGSNEDGMARLSKPNAPPSSFPNGDRNYYNLVELIDYFNDDWDFDSGYLKDYGCHCNGDLSRHPNGHGETPRDPIDSACATWKRCLRCSTMVYGEDCLSQNSRYKAELVDGQMQCAQSIGSCRRSICECDLQFAQNIGKHASKWKASYWSTPSEDHLGFDKAQCVKNPPTSYEPACCLNPISGLLNLYNKKQKCCDDQGIVQQNGFCENGDYNAIKYNYRRK